MDMQDACGRFSLSQWMDGTCSRWELAQRGRKGMGIAVVAWCAPCLVLGGASNSISRLKVECTRTNTRGARSR